MPCAFAASSIRCCSAAAKALICAPRAAVEAISLSMRAPTSASIIRAIGKYKDTSPARVHTGTPAAFRAPCSDNCRATHSSVEARTRSMFTPHQA